MTEEKSKTTIQKFSWKNFKKFKTYEEADQARSTLLKDNEKVKVRRCGPSGTLFVVKIGTPITKNKGDNNATK